VNPYTKIDARRDKACLENYDDELRIKLADLGFQPAEIERQLDRKISQEVKVRERVSWRLTLLRRQCLIN
jgi:hypothetical protein